MAVVNSLFSGLFAFLIKLVFWLLGVIVSLIIWPIQALLVTAFPDIGSFLTTLVNYFTNQLFPMISFIRDIILHILCIPEGLYNALIGILVFRIAFVPAIIFVKTALNAWKIKSGNIKLS